MPDLAGQSLGRYHIIERLGEGGMATVYQAFDTRLERKVAIKVIRADVSDPTFFVRFEREAKALAQLSHLHIVKVYDYGEHEGQPYLVMEYIPGGTLKKLTGAPMPYARAARLLAPVASALDYAHVQGIIHRDVKPANILLTGRGEPMLSDFGVAKILEKSLTVELTGSGVSIGTPEYMAPEQWMGKVVSQTDIYALGVVFFELVTGRRPYIADTPAAVLIKQVTEPLPRPRQFVPDLPEDAEMVLLKALAKEPGERYAKAAALAGELERLASGGRRAQPGEAGAALLPVDREVDTLPTPGQEAALGARIAQLRAQAEAALQAEDWTQVYRMVAELAGLGEAGHEEAERLTIAISQARKEAQAAESQRTRLRQDFAARLADEDWTAAEALLAQLRQMGSKGVQSADSLAVELAQARQTAAAQAERRARLRAGAMDFIENGEWPQAGELLDELRRLGRQGEAEADALGHELEQASGKAAISSQRSAVSSQPSARSVVVSRWVYWVAGGVFVLVVGLLAAAGLLAALIRTGLPNPTEASIGNEGVQAKPPATSAAMGKEAVSTQTPAVVGITLAAPAAAAAANSTPADTQTAAMTPALGIPTQVSPKDGMVQVYVPAGEFKMGSENGSDDEKPVHTVDLDAYWIDQTEVTNGMYAQCVSAGACKAPYQNISQSRKSYYGNPPYADYPVISVDWMMADAYCTWVDRSLPTEAQWEKAARGTDGRTYPWGEGIDCNQANYAGKSGNSFCVGDTTAVGSYPGGASPYGALDMAGNVWEWVADWYDSGYYGKSPFKNPKGPDSSNFKVLRGGSWSSYDDNARSGYRIIGTPGDRDVNYGFRCASSQK